ncbi:acyl-CoA desaturase, partial [Bacillus thuringiensis]|nr:acyl-CoA desaturase [Bacillus thuringiensis]
LFSFLSLTIQFTLQSTRMLFHFIIEFKSTNQKSVWLPLLLPWKVWIGLLFIMGTGKWSFAYVIPLLIANFIVMAYIATNHRLTPIVPVKDPLA